MRTKLFIYFSNCGLGDKKEVERDKKEVKGTKGVERVCFFH